MFVGEQDNIASSIYLGRSCHAGRGRTFETPFSVMVLHFSEQIERSHDPDHDFGFSVEQTANHGQQVPLLWMKKGVSTRF